MIYNSIIFEKENYDFAIGFCYKLYYEENIKCLSFV